MKFKFNLLKLNKDKLPPLKSLRPKIFDVDLYWYASLGLVLVIFLITAFIGFKLFYSQYFETYKQSSSSQNFENLINIERLKSAIQKRSDLINKPISFPKDPSL
jgi:hypothetical protein